MIAIITLTQGGLTLAKELSDHIEAKIIYKPKPFKETVHSLYKAHDQLIFIMATGIVVRTLAPLLEHKSKDPAVIVMDEKGQYVISLLSGHLGGANYLANQLAKFTKGQAVITTASDVNGLLSVDMLAEKYDLVLEDFDGARDVTAVLVDGGKVKVEGIEIDEKNYVPYQADALVYVSQEKKECNQPSVQLLKRNLVIGMGCRRDTPFEKLYEFIKVTLASEGYSLKCICKLTSAWVKADEIGLIELADMLNIPFETYNQSEIKEVSDLFQASTFVLDTLGVANVSEPCGYLGSDRGRCLINKRKHNGMTMSLWLRG